MRGVWWVSGEGGVGRGGEGAGEGGVGGSGRGGGGGGEKGGGRGGGGRGGRGGGRRKVVVKQGSLSECLCLLSLFYLCVFSSPLSVARDEGYQRALVM